MIYYDENGNIIEEPDCSYGWLEYNAEVVSEEFVDGVHRKICEATAAVFHPYTPEEQAAHDAERAEYEARSAIPDDIADLQDAVVEVAGISAGNELSIADIEDALIELAELIGGAE